MIRCYIKVKGKVQGVGFRKFTKKIAAKYKVVGCVRNVEDGTVEADVQGEKEHIDLVIKALKKGSRSSKVNSVEVKKIKNLKNYTTFNIVYNLKK
jgi:acylphosphatase